MRYAREMALLEIEDTGPGMTPAELASVFEPFERGSQTGQSPPGSGASGGAGLGLTIAKMLTDLMGGEMTVSSTPGQGSVFRIKLFLPEVHPGSVVGKRAVLPASRRQPHGYLGPRRKLLVVDNEEPDRELLQQLLTPMGFELRSAASGHDCLDLLAAGYRPDVILMDLAMPGIDGWETIRRLRAAGHRDIHMAIVSANAFDKGLENDVSIAPEDFIVKPVRHSELLDWLERRLSLVWTDEVMPEMPSMASHPPVAPQSWPTSARVQALAQLVSLGYFRGVMNQLDDIEALQPECASFVQHLRALARQFQFEAMSQYLVRAPSAPAHEPEAC